MNHATLESTPVVLWKQFGELSKLRVDSMYVAMFDEVDEGTAIEKKAFDGPHNPIRMRKFGIPSAWFETFHISGPGSWGRSKTP